MWVSGVDSASSGLLHSRPFLQCRLGDGCTGSLDSVVQQIGELSQEDLVLVEDFLAEADFFHEINRLDLDDTMDLLVLLEPIPKFRIEIFYENTLFYLCSYVGSHWVVCRLE